MADYTKSTNFTAKDSLPSGNAGKIIKGAEIDTEFTAIASAIASKANINSPALTGTPTGPTASYGTNTTQLATTAFVQAAIPSGVILLWSGSIATIPGGWALCNGSNGTPDLRDRFVVGAGSTYSVGATGGANTVTLDATQIPSHTHTVTTTGTTSSENAHSHTFSGTTSNMSANASHSHNISDPGHTHTIPTSDSGASSGQADVGATAPEGTLTTNSATTGITINSTSVEHTHTYSGTTSTTAAHTHTLTLSSTAGNTGGGLAHENRPPYYALAYIMRL
jgi:microcystin-dependent protein